MQQSGRLAAAANHSQTQTRGGGGRGGGVREETYNAVNPFPIYTSISNCFRQNQCKNAHLQGHRRPRSSPLIVDPTEFVPELSMAQAPMRKVHTENGGTRVDGVGRRFRLLKL